MAAPLEGVKIMRIEGGPAGHESRVFLVDADGTETDVSRYFSAAEVSISVDRATTVWLRAPVVSINVEAQLRAIAGERFYVRVRGE